MHNDGSGTLEEQWARPGRTLDVAAGDFDGNGRTDAATLTLSGGVRACGVKGKATLIVHTKLDSGRPSKDPASYEAGFRPTNLSVGDLDGDGLADIVVGDHVEAYDPGGSSRREFCCTTSFYPWAGDRRARYRSCSIATLSTAVTVGDVDDDGDADIVVTSYPYMGNLENVWWRDLRAAENLRCRRRARAQVNRT